MAKPDDLPFPCSVCTKWREREGQIAADALEHFWHDTTHIRDNDVRTCIYDPRNNNLDKWQQCPHFDWFFKNFPAVQVICDVCYQAVIIEYPVMSNITPPDPEYDNKFICHKCLDLPLYAPYKAQILATREAWIQKVSALANYNLSFFRKGQ